MSTKSRLDKLYKSCPRIRLPEDVKILFITDLHMGDGGPEDDFVKNAELFNQKIQSFYEDRYYLVLLGDIWDIWECPQTSKIKEVHRQPNIIIDNFNALNFLIKIKGNHDNSLDYPESVVLQIGNLEIFCCHGHQGDIFNDRLWWIGQNVVRYLWVPLQWIGLHDAQRAKRKRHELQEIRLNEWAKNQSFVSVFGHTHLLADVGNYKNAGSWVQMGGEGIEFLGGKFSDKHF